MTDREVIELINSLLVDEFEFDPAEMLPGADLFEDLGLDSLDIFDMVVLLETAFKFKIREDVAIREIRKLGQIHDFVLAKKRDLPSASPQT
jgi:acyl carrier protein